MLQEGKMELIDLPAEGRPLNVAEQEDIVNEHGRPALVASRYRRLPIPHLVGPAMFPFYWYSLVILVSIVGVVNAGLAVGAAITGTGLLPALFQAWGRFWLGTMATVGVVTSVFALLEYFRIELRFLEHWTPRSLPAVDRDAESTPRCQPAVQLVLGVLLLLWWIVPPFLPAAGVRMGPAWQSFEIPVMLLVLAATACSFVNLVRPGWAFFRSLSRIAIDGIGLVIASLVLQSDGLLVFIAGGRQLSMVADIITWGICFSFILAFVLDSITEACHLVRRGPSRALAGIIAG